MRVKNLCLGLAALTVLCGGLLFAARSVQAAAATPQGNFSLQVTPSPLVTTLKPGTTTDLELKVRNAGTSTENLRIDTRSFKLNNSTSEVQLNDQEPSEIGQWITFANPTFTVLPGQWFTEKIHFALPKDTGFSYSFALVISRKDTPAPVSGGRLIKGSIAVFTLVNVDRPGATRKLEIPKFTSTRGFYEYLPTSFNIQFKNTGNSIVQPTGNIFIQRSSGGSPISTLTVNETKGYILPGNNRTVSADWNSGFPVYKTTTDGTGKTKSSLVWDWGNAKFSNIRIGRYTAKLVAIYDDGNRDVPIQMEINFWVIPWRLVIGFVVVAVGLFFLGRWRNRRRTQKAVKKALEAVKKDAASKTEKGSEA